MHIVDGALSSPVLITGTALTAIGCVVGLRRIQPEQIPLVGILSAVFFLASLIQIPIGPSSVHLLLNGIMGLCLGWAAFPAVLVALVLQKVFFGFGGITTLGVNTFNVAFGAVVAGMCARHILRFALPHRAIFAGAIAGGLGVLLSALGIALALMLSGDAFIPSAKLAMIAHGGVFVVEAIVSAIMISMIIRVKPSLLNVLAQEEATSHA